MQPSATGGKPKPQSIDLFKAGDSFPAYKRVTFKRKDSFTITAELVGKNATSNVVGSFEVAGHADMNDMAAPKIKVNIAYDADGIFRIQSAHFMKELPPEPEPEPAPEPEKPKEEPAAAKADKAEKPSEKGDEKKPDAETEKPKEGEEAKASAGDAKAKEEKPEDAKAKEEKPKEEKKEEEKPAEKKPPKVKFTQVALGVKSSISGALSKSKIDAHRNREAALAQEERIARERDERRNDLETYVYDIRDKVESYDFESYMLPDARAAYVATLESTEDWLYTDEGNDSSKKVYVDKLAALRIIGDRVLTLKRERENIAEAVENFKLAQTKDLSVVDSADEKYAHLTKEEREAVRTTWSEGLEFVNTGLAKNASLKNHEDLAITIADVTKKQTECARKSQPTITKPKPKPKPKPEPKPEENKEGKAEEGKADAKPEADAAKPEEGKADAAPAAESAKSETGAKGTADAAAGAKAGDGDPKPPCPDEVD